MLRSQFQRKKKSGIISGIVIKNIDWNNRSIDFFMKYKGQTVEVNNFCFGTNETFSCPDSKFDFIVISRDNSIILSILEQGNTLFEKEINFSTLKVL